MLFVERKEFGGRVEGSGEGGVVSRAIIGRGGGRWGSSGRQAEIAERKGFEIAEFER